MGWSKKIDTSISKALANGKLQTRPSCSPGTWLIFLLPSAIILTALTRNVPHVYSMCSLFAGNLLLNGIVLLVHIRWKTSIAVTKSFNLYAAVPVAITGIFYNRFLALDIFRAVCHSVANSLLYFETLSYLLKSFPKAFSFGEANVVAQSLSLFVYTVYTWFNHISLMQPLSNDTDIISTISQVALIYALFICLIPTSWSKTSQYIALIALSLAIVPLLNFLLQRNSILWVVEFIFSHSRLRLVSWWAACSGLAWGTVVLQIRSKRKATTDVRKVFHFLATLVFLSGVLVDPVMLNLAANLALPLFLLIEFVRIRKLPPFGKALQDGFHIYADEKDAGGVALTPIYLLIGCSAPLWLLPHLTSSASTLPLMSGILAIGVGDSFASIVGQNFGRHKWPGSKKSVEGSIASFLSQLLVVLLLSSFGLLPSLSIDVTRLAKPIVAIAANTLVEAKTDQVDNLVLPLVTYIILIL